MSELHVPDEAIDTYMSDANDDLPPEWAVGNIARPVVAAELRRIADLIESDWADEIGSANSGGIASLLRGRADYLHTEEGT